MKNEPSEPALAGRVAIVTGGSQGIGAAVASALVADGARVMLCGRTAEALTARAGEIDTTADLSETSGAVETFLADVREPSQVEALVAHTESTWGGLDIVVNNAGLGRFRPMAEMSPDEWREVVETNLHGVFFLSHAAVPALRRRGGGWIVNVSSLAGSHPFPGGGAYCASKAGLDAFSEVMMQELRHDDIRVSCVAPGSVATRFAGQDVDAGASWKLDPLDVARVVVDLLRHDPRSLPSRVEIRPARKK